MTQLKVRALGSLFIWSIVMIALLIIFFVRGGPSTFLDGDTRVELTRVCFSLGFGAYFFMLFLTKVKSDKGKLLKDERDDRIARHANASAFSLLLVYVFVLSLFLYWYYKVHLGEFLMPVGWIWFLAISSYFVGFLTQAVTTLVLYSRMSGHAEG
jgi:hypothetical protein